MTYAWSPAVTDGVPFIVGETTTYEVLGVDENGCKNTDELTVHVEDPIIPLFETLNAICKEEEMVLPSTSDNGIEGTWSPAFDNTQTTTYTFTPNATTGCVETVEITIIVNPAPDQPTIVTNPADCDNPSTSFISNYNGSNTYTFDPVGPFITESGGIGGMEEGISYTVVADNGNCFSNESESFGLTVLFAPDVQFNGDGEGCVPVGVQFQSNSENSSDYLWEFGDGSTSTQANPSHTYTTEGCYDVTLTVTNADGCSSTLVAEDFICVSSSPIADFTTSNEESDEVVDEVNFYNNSTGATSYQWTFGDGGSSTETNPTYGYEESLPGNHIITLVAYNDAGCTDTAQTIIEVPEDITFFVPNAFTPDGDDFNGVFMPVFSPNVKPRDFGMLIFNRWGELIFETHNVDVGWNGSYLQNKEGLVQEGTYIWKISFKKNTTDDVIYRVGHVTLLK